MIIFPLVILLVSFAVTFGTTSPTLQDLKTALNTEEKIWILQRNFLRQGESGDISCVYSKKQSLEGLSYIFFHGYKEGSHWKKTTLYGTLKQEGNDAILTVRETQGGTGNDHVLESWNAIEHCFILTFQNSTSGLKQCALHVYESAFSSQPCKTEYANICGDTKHVVTTQQCLSSVPPADS